jgi:hypothetical protein
MKAFILAAALPLVALSAIAQQSETVTVNTLNSETAKQKTVLFNPYFAQGKVVFKDESFAQPALNYNRLTGQMLFLTPKGDTLALSHPETTQYVLVGVDTFAFHENSFLLKVTHFGTGPNLYVKQYMKLMGREKKGPYGTYSPLSASNSNSTYTNDDQQTKYIAVDENHLYKPGVEYYLSDANNNKFYEASKKGFYSAFPAHEKKLKEFLTAYRPDYNSEQDLMQVFQYIQKQKK